MSTQTKPEIESTPSRTSPECSKEGLENSRIMKLIGMILLGLLVIVIVILMILDKMYNLTSILTIVIVFIGALLVGYFGMRYFEKCKDKVK